MKVAPAIGHDVSARLVGQDDVIMVRLLPISVRGRSLKASGAGLDRLPSLLIMETEVILFCLA